MFQFLNPIWLFAASAIIIPVIIHLWNIRPGKVLKVGSVSLIAEASRQSSRSFKLLDIPLFLLRCLLLILLALLLALPILQKRLHTAKAKGWILLPKENFSDGYQHYKSSIDSLTRLGYEFHYFNQGFPKADLPKLLAETKDLKAIDTTLQQPQQYWNLIRQLDSKVPSEMPVFLFTGSSISHFSNAKPAVSLNLTWKTFSTADSVKSWIQGAWFNGNNTIRVVRGISKPSGTTYQYDNISSDKGNSQYNVSVINGQPTVTLNSSKGDAVNVDTSVLRIAVYTDRYTADAGYLKAALDAVAQFNQRKAVVKQYTSPAAIPASQKWIFWLSDKPFPDNLLKDGAKIFAYQNGKQTTAATWIVPAEAYALPNNAEQIPLFKIINATGRSGQVIWHDGFGRPVLTAEQREEEVYHFYSRFNPTWNDMVWSTAFPKLMLQLLNNSANNPVPKFDNRAIAEQQIQPVKITEQHTIADKFTVQKDLSIWFWLALVIVFLAERWLATQNKMVQTNG